jgi:hypothetical protein
MSTFLPGRNQCSVAREEEEEENMSMSQRIRSDWLPAVDGRIRAGEVARRVRGFWRIGLPALAGLLMVVAGFIPWLLDPLGRPMMAWQIPLELGWQIPGGIWSGLINYGMLCLGCALAIWMLALRAWKTRGGSLVGAGVTTRDCRMLALLCLFPIALFVTQLLYMDMGSVMRLANGAIQMMLIRSEFGYGSPPQFFPIEPSAFDPLMLDSRVALLFNQLTGGAFVPFFAVLMLLASQQLFPHPLPGRFRRRRTTLFVIAGALIALLLLGRTPVALACTFEADHLLMGGEYTRALGWLDRAVWFNPSLDLVPGYHLMRGQAWYFLHPDQPDAESIAYRAAFYRQQNDLLAAYQELLAARQHDSQASWLLDEMRTTLTQLSDMTHPLRGVPLNRLSKEQAALTWLNALIQVDPTNVYAPYTAGRVYYDINDYYACEQQMFKVLALSQNNEIQSSAYTYLALSRIKQGDVLSARDYLFKAQALDNEYRNNLARQALSGLR